jgi:hypothetical protein
VVLYGGDDDFIALLYTRLAERKSQRIDTVRRAFGEDDFVTALRSDKFRHGLACLLVVASRHLAQVMHAAVDIAVPMGISLSDGIYHRLRFLACSRIIEID